MTRCLGVLLVFGGVIGWPAGLQSAPRVAFVPSRSVIVSDPIPDVNLPAPAEREALFLKKLETAYSGQVLQLGPNTMISPDERVIVLVPSITAARTTHEVKAGSIHNFESVIVGDVSAVDPWSGAILYSATRMVIAEVSLGQSKIAEASTELPKAFRVTYDRWLDACIEQMKRDLEPFDLTADTLVAPEKARTSPGGIWPFGSERGVRQGTTLMGTNGQRSEVTSVYPKFSAIRDIASSSRAIPAGETYSLTVVEKPSERPEPRVALSWLGTPPNSDSSSGGQSISSEVALSLFANYLTRSGALRVLPHQDSSQAVRDQFRAISDDVSRHSKLVVKNAMTFERDSLVRLALEAPEYRVELGVLDSYLGSRTRSDGSVEHLFRLTFAAAIYGRTDSDESAVYPVLSVVRHTEELARIEMQGVRQEDPASAWLTISRNGLIRLAKEVLEKISSQDRGNLSWREGVVSTDHQSVDWNGAPPISTAPISWLRAAGPIVNTRGEILGTYFKRQVPAQGFLNARVLGNEKLQAGDILRFQSIGTATATLGLQLTTGANALASLPDPHWIALLAADGVVQRSHCQCHFALINKFGANSAAFERVLKLNVTAASLNQHEDGMAFSGQWRVRLAAPSASLTSQPMLFGLEVKTRVAQNSPTPHLSPTDLQGAAVDYTAEALNKLTDLGMTKGLGLVLSPHN